MKFSDGVNSDQIQAAQKQVAELGVENLHPVVQERTIRGLKFAECLSPRLAEQVTSMRLRDEAAVLSIMNENIRVAIPSPDESFKPSIGSRRSSHATPKQPESSKFIRVGTIEIELDDSEMADKSLRALSVRHPWAELILRVEKEIEFRNYPTDVRGTDYTYASATRYPAEDEQEMQTEFDLDLDNRPRGVIVGTVEVYDYQQDADGGYEWLIRSPTRLRKPLKPKRKPKPSWLFPF
jgi:hypothetical protein